MTISRRSAATALSATALLAATAGVAHAGPPWTISIGGSSTGTPVPFTATSGTIEWTVPGMNLTCDSGTAEGTIHPGPTSGPAAIVTSTTFNGCMFPLGMELSVVQASDWNVNLTGDNSGGVTPGEITNVNASVSDADGLCSFDVSGSVASSFDENTQQLTADNTGSPTSLLVSDVDGCFGLVLAGDPLTFSATYEVDQVAAVTITN